MQKKKHSSVFVGQYFSPTSTNWSADNEEKLEYIFTVLIIVRWCVIFVYALNLPVIQELMKRVTESRGVDSTIDFTSEYYLSTAMTMLPIFV